MTFSVNSVANEFMTSTNALAGLNIVVTRPRAQATPLARAIEQAGGKALLFPLLEIESGAASQPLRELVSRLPQFDLAIFISPNAVRYGMQAIRAAGPLPATLKLACVGQGSANALRELGVQQVVAPQQGADSEALLALPELQQVAGWHVAIFRGDGGRELLADVLTARGAKVEYAACYQRVKAELDVAALLAAAPHALTVTSSEALMHLWERSDMQARDSLSELPLFVSHERIARLARTLGFDKVGVTQSGDGGMVAALIAWAQQ